MKKKLGEFGILNIAGDFHDSEGLKRILNKFDNVICLGDIGAAIERSELFNNWERFNKSWKAFANKDFSTISQEDKEWFRKVNIEGWKKQLEIIKNSKKSFILNMGNADLAMISFFQECSEHLNKNIKKAQVELIRNPTIKNFGNIQIIFLPYRKDSYEIESMIENIDLNKPLFIIAHCPALKISKKLYYMNHYKAVESISKKYDKTLFYIHGHTHPDNSYIYSEKKLPNVTFLTPKSEENFDGININHHIIQINTKNGEIKLLDSVSSKYIEFEKLPEKFLINDDHWNNFQPQKLKNR